MAWERVRRGERVNGVGWCDHAYRVRLEDVLPGFELLLVALVLGGADLG